MPDKTPGPDEVAIAGRLLAAYHAASRRQPVRRPDVWTDIARRQQPFESLLAEGDARRLAAYLCNVSRHDASEGITQGAAEHERLLRDRSYRNFVARMAQDKLVSLAEAVGAVPVENPEQGDYGNVDHELGRLVDSTSERIGISIDPPDIDGGLLKINTGRGLFGERDANAIYTAWLLKSLRPESVCEIGAGSGRLAYWSYRLGLEQYTTIDLPRVNVVQGYYLLKTLPSVSLYGEAPQSVRVLPTLAVNEPHAVFDLVINQDSFPEIDRETVAGYLRWIRGCSRRFVSINHESKPHRPDGIPQLSVPEVISEVGGFRLEQRWPYWLRKGYVVEVYGV